jgi:DNA (cytosine-5)-methyltransferase 1
MPQCIEVCAGAGGLALGQELEGFEHVLLLEKDKTCCETLKVNRSDWNVQCLDMNAFNVEEFMLHKGLSPGDLDLLSGGIPCQPFSYAGKKQGMNDQRSNVFQKFVEMITELKPKVVMIENVKGLMSIENGNILQNVIVKEIEDCGYKVTYKVLNANDYNVAQKRERLIIIGVERDSNIDFEFPQKQELKPVLQDVLTNIDDEDPYQQEYYEYNAKMKGYLSKIPQGGCWTSLPNNEQREVLGKSYESGGGKRGVAKRLSMSEPSLTLTTSPNQKQTCRCHPLETRPLTVREYARIQSFPDEWKFCGGKAKKYHQIGNAVPVNLARAISKSIKEYLQALKK